ncbi:hypothetical protein GE115_10810 [Agromyces sp. CFH 90414]|uniref:GAP family protein n=1 Tax=Agromyces agglutinans TaxID=2662258 RepID=A0A6I2F7Q1_9MICO|nr:GAP family protein [Agromyces agglutinans]MRG60351.1 hypothetical protein [Agromyces agglutinans]
MGQLIAEILPLALGIVFSPLAIMALVAVLVSPRARLNGFAFLLGWGLAVLVVFALGLWLFQVIEVHLFEEPPLWIVIVRLVLGLFLVAAAVWVYRSGQVHVDSMAKATTPGEVVRAAPQLPGWLRAVQSFTFFRTVLLGFGIFALNPVDLTCALIASLDVILAALPEAQTVLVGTGFVVLGILPIAVPTVLVFVRGAAAAPFLGRLRTWIASHTNVLNAALMLVIGVLQLQKALVALL